MRELRERLGRSLQELIRRARWVFLENDRSRVKYGDAGATRSRHFTLKVTELLLFSIHIFYFLLICEIVDLSLYC